MFSDEHLETLEMGVNAQVWYKTITIYKCFRYDFMVDRVNSKWAREKRKEMCRKNFERDMLKEM
jgi:hypothetical protein